jgi:hypothetical protein
VVKKLEALKLVRLRETFRPDVHLFADDFCKSRPERQAEQATGREPV